ncbi:hypothetical protein G5T42_16315 [Microbacterium sp. 4R-513]|uniref:STM3941 family protein n=1 Tax=Microbacterium sp. 4R-513 TaxID=2567934 RepID=UPI0013E131BC|nr:STM3941 family protein [Microbacterium sp. 4R-513]QIG40843.1 hypothetical protein G5T42_16315 [Microbacterium sp. 4R-513]
MSTSAPPLRIVTPRGRLIALAIVCAVIAALGVVVYLVNPQEPLNIILGAAAVGVFGVGGGISLVSQFRRSTLLTADEQGIRIEGRVTVPWSAIDRIGTTQTAVGIRLRDPKAVADAAPGVYTLEGLKANRSATGWDLTFEERLLGRPPREAAAALRARQP